MSIVLIIQEEGQENKVTLSNEPTLLGRSSSCHIKLKDEKVSGKHLSVVIGKDEKTLIEDLNTTNGTFLNDSRILESHLFLEDEIRIGNILIYLDPFEMNPSEKSIHTRSGEKTQHTFVNLPIGELDGLEDTKTDTLSKKPAAKPKVNYKNPGQREEEINKLLNSEQSISKKIETPKPGLKTRIIEKAKKNREKKYEERLGDEILEFENSSGMTKTLKIDKPKK